MTAGTDLLLRIAWQGCLEDWKLCPVGLDQVRSQALQQCMFAGYEKGYVKACLEVGSAVGDQRGAYSVPLGLVIFCGMPALTDFWSLPVPMRGWFSSLRV